MFRAHSATERKMEGKNDEICLNRMCAFSKIAHKCGVQHAKNKTVQLSLIAVLKSALFALVI